MKRGIAYARVSTKIQATTGYSLGQQIDACQKYAEQHGITIIEVCQDEVSGRTMQRAGLMRAITMIEAKEADALIVFVQDRLNRDSLDFKLLRRQIQTAGGDIHYASSGRVAGRTGLERVREDMEAIMAEIKIEKLQERTLRGRRGKAEAGKYMGIGSQPYGYDRNGFGKQLALMVNKQEATVVRNIFEWYAAGVGIVEILQRLNAANIPSPGERLGRAKVRGLSEWAAATVYRILKNSAYSGTAYSFRLTKKCTDKSTTERPKEDWIPTEVPTIVDKDLYEVVQQKLSEGRRRAKGNTKHPYLMQKQIKCSCGCHMTGTPNYNGKGRMYLYYRCNGSSGGTAIPRCNMKRVRVDILDALMWDWTVNKLLNEDELEANMRYLKERQHIENAHIEVANKRLEVERVTVERRLQRVRDAYEAEVDTLEEYHQNKLSIEAELRKIAERTAELEKTTVFELTNDQIGAVKQLAAKLRIGAAKATFEEQRLLIEVLEVWADVAVVSGEIMVKATSAISEDWLSFHSLLSTDCLHPLGS